MIFVLSFGESFVKNCILYCNSLHFSEQSLGIAKPIKLGTHGDEDESAKEEENGVSDTNAPKDGFEMACIKQFFFLIFVRWWPCDDPMILV